MSRLSDSFTLRTGVVAFTTGLLAVTLSGSVCAQSLRVKSEAIVTTDTIRLDHLIDGIGKGGDVPVFRAPVPGGRGTIRAERIVQAARELGILDIEAGDVASVAIIRPGRTISRDEMQDSIGRTASERGALGDLAIVLDDHHSSRTVDAHRNEGVKVSTFVRDTRSGRFEARLMLPGQTDTGESWIVTGSIVETRELAVPVSDLDRNEPIQMKDLVIIKRPAGQVGTDVIRPVSELVGMIPKRALRAGEPIRNGDVSKPILVDKNQLVNVTYTSSGLTLSMRGRAQNSATLGETVKIQNPQSKRMVEGTVTGPAQVSVTTFALPPASLAQAPTTPHR